MRKVIYIFILCLCLCGCVTDPNYVGNPYLHDKKEEQEKKQKERLELIEQKARERELLYSTFTDKELKAIENEQFFLGMSRLALIESIGVPDDINETVGSWGVHEQFVYSHYDLYVYLENGIVTSWQK